MQWQGLQIHDNMCKYTILAPSWDSHSPISYITMHINAKCQLSRHNSPGQTDRHVSLLTTLHFKMN